MTDTQVNEKMTPEKMAEMVIARVKEVQKYGIKVHAGSGFGAVSLDQKDLTFKFNRAKVAPPYDYCCPLNACMINAKKHPEARNGATVASLYLYFGITEDEMWAFIYGIDNSHDDKHPTANRDLPYWKAGRHVSETLGLTKAGF